MGSLGLFVRRMIALEVPHGMFELIWFLRLRPGLDTTEQLEVAELCVGVGTIQRVFEQLGMSAAAFDKTYAPDNSQD